MRRLVGGIVVALLSMAAVPASAKPPPKPARPAGPLAPGPDAAQVVVRRSASLTRAVRAAYDRATDLSPASAVFLVFDAGPGVAGALPDILEAVKALSDAKPPGAWLAAPLGGSFASSVAAPADLAAAISSAVAQRTDKWRDGVGLLRRTLRSAGGRPGLVLYFAHAHLEDDCNLEELIGDLTSAKRRLCVIGPEAAFECSWGEMFAEDVRYAKNGDLDFSAEGVGRNPFGEPDPKAPWRGGDTAYPMMPYEFGTSADWDTRLSRRASSLDYLTEQTPDPRVDPDGFYEWVGRRVVPPDREKASAAYRAWLARVGNPPDKFRSRPAYEKWQKALDASAPTATAAVAPTSCPSLLSVEQWMADSWQERPVPSSFGPYGWMRAAGATGGSYVLWGWGKGGTVPYKYDYTKCNGLPPDLRARPEVLADALKRPLAVALTAAWVVLAEPGITSAINRTSPIVNGAPAVMEHDFGVLFSPIYKTPAERDRAVDDATKTASRIDRVRSALAQALEKAHDPKDDVERRLKADAELFLHGLETVHFHLSELIACLTRIPPSAWKLESGRQPGVQRVDWICAGTDDVEPTAPRLAAYDRDAGEKIAAARKAFLARYKGTPMGAIAARNPVSTYRPDIWSDPHVSGGYTPPPAGSGSSRGGGTSTPPPADGSSGASGPTTGR